MVQIKQRCQVYHYTYIENFISHMVQIKRFRGGNNNGSGSHFISHMVQIKLEPESVDIQGYCNGLYIPYGSNKTWGVHIPNLPFHLQLYIPYGSNKTMKYNSFCPFISCLYIPYGSNKTTTASKIKL